MMVEGYLPRGYGREQGTDDGRNDEKEESVMIGTYEVEIPRRIQVTYDISELIRSADMRKLVQQARPLLSPADVEQVILYSNLSLERKVEELNALADLVRNVASDDDFPEKILQMADMLKRCLFQIYKPEERALYILRDAGQDDIYCYDSFSELEEIWCDLDGEEDSSEEETETHTEFSCYHVTQLKIGKDKTSTVLDFTIQQIRGRYVVRAVQPSGEWFQENGVTRETISRFTSGLDLDVLALDFPENERWKYQTPSMKHPAYGVLRRDRTEGYWPFRSENNMDSEIFDNLDTDYSGDMFSVLDWLERAPEEKMDSEKTMELPFS